MTAEDKLTQERFDDIVRYVYDLDRDLYRELWSYCITTGASEPPEHLLDKLRRRIEEREAAP